MNRAGTAVFCILGGASDFMVSFLGCLSQLLRAFLQSIANICKLMRRFAKFPVLRDKHKSMTEFREGFKRTSCYLACSTSIQRNLRAFILDGGTVYSRESVTHWLSAQMRSSYSAITNPLHMIRYQVLCMVGSSPPRADLPKPRLR